jgi:hypothetical protein
MLAGRDIVYSQASKRACKNKKPSGAPSRTVSHPNLFTLCTLQVLTTCDGAASFFRHSITLAVLVLPIATALMEDHRTVFNQCLYPSW